MLLIRHYFPGVNIETLSDEEFASLANEAEWLDAHQLKVNQARTLGML